MNNLWRNLRYGLRGLWKHPGFTLVAVFSLALGIGANTAIFSLVNEVLFKPLPFREADRLAMVWEDSSAIGFPRDTPAPANYADWKAQNQVFEDMAALDWRNFNLTGDGEPEKVMAFGVTANFFSLLGVQPALGRSFLPAEDKPGTNKVVVLSHQLWQRRYGGQADIVGKDILLNYEKYTVVGVMPVGFQFMQAHIGLWVPMALSAEELASRGNHYLNVVGRLKPGVSVEQAQADIGLITERIARTYPDEAGNLKAAVVSLREQLAGDARRPLSLLLVAVGFVLLIACANIANLLLARAAHRRKEIAIRTALGASRSQIIVQLLTESVLLAGLGGVLGAVLASWSFEFLRKLIPPGMTMTTELKLDLPVLLFTLAVSLLTGLVFGLLPAIQASKVDFHETLKQGGRGSLSAVGNRMRGALVVTEVTLALVLLVGAGLLVQTLYHLQNQYALFQPDQLLAVRTGLPDGKYNEHAKRVAFYDQVLERVNALPGVVSAGYTTSVPLQWKGGANGFSIEGREPQQNVPPNANHRQISEQYLQTMGIALREGRYFDNHDDRQAVPVVIVNETLARQHWPGQSPLGKRIKIGAPESDRPWLTIVGVVADVRQMGLDVPVKAEMYLPYRQITTHLFFRPRDLVIRSSGPPLDLVSAVRREVHAVDPDQPLSNIATMSEQLGEETQQRRIGMILLVTFAALALLLATLGIYGVLAYFVAQHTSEIGVRMALGAQRRDVLGMVLGKGMTLVGLGIGLGLAVALILTRLMKSLLYGVAAADPLTFVGIAALLALVAFLACYLPAQRATKVDPLIALRAE